jgi:hypothetical protein
LINFLNFFFFFFLSTFSFSVFAIGHRSKVRMMRGDKNARVALSVALPDGLTVDACEVPFIGGAVFTVIKPTSEGKGPAAIADAAAALDAVRAAFPTQPVKSKIWLPAFTVTDK